MQSYSIEVIAIFFILVFILGVLLGIFFTIVKINKVNKKDQEQFDIFLAKRESKIKALALQAKELQKNY